MTHAHSMSGLRPATRTEREVREERAAARLAKFASMKDEDFIRQVLRGSRYLDNTSRENAREALRRLDRLTSRYTNGDEFPSGRTVL